MTETTDDASTLARRLFPTIPTEPPADPPSTDEAAGTSAFAHRLFTPAPEHTATEGDHA